MARKAKIASNEKRKKLSQKYFLRRAELRKKACDTKLSEVERYEARLKLQRLPKNSCSIRVRNRCELTGHTRGNYRAFGLSRMVFRELALKGMIPGVTKSSW